MFADLIQWITGRPAETTAYDQAFLQEVTVRHPLPPDPKVERFILGCWILIAVKHVAVIWAVKHYHMPFHQLLVNAPTWIFAFVATAAYYLRRE
jgi:hypothetical protein